MFLYIIDGLDNKYSIRYETNSMQAFSRHVRALTGHNEPVKVRHVSASTGLNR